jgi:large subunit ribosomal protein L30
MARLKITQTRSIIDRLENQKRTIKALGLGRPNYVVYQNDTPQIRGMLRKVFHLVKVEEVADEAPAATGKEDLP